MHQAGKKDYHYIRMHVLIQLSSWRWAHQCSKHVEECNKCIKIKNLCIKLLKKDCNCIRTHGQQNAKKAVLDVTILQDVSKSPSVQTHRLVHLICHVTVWPWTLRSLDQLCSAMFTVRNASVCLNTYRGVGVGASEPLYIHALSRPELFPSISIDVSLKIHSYLTFWRRNYFLILAHAVYKMWIIQEPNMLELWNKLHFEEEETESIYHV